MRPPTALRPRPAESREEITGTLTVGQGTNRESSGPPGAFPAARSE